MKDLETSEKIAQWVIDNRYQKFLEPEGSKISEFEMFHTLRDAIDELRNEAFNYYTNMGKITIDAPKVFPGAICFARNYRSKPNNPWVLVKVMNVESGWSKAGKPHHSYRCIRLNSPDPNDYVLGSYRGRKGEGGAISLTVNDETIKPS
jgi:hypothetical protein